MVFVAMWPVGRFDFVTLPTGFKATFATYIESCLKPPLKSLPAQVDRKKVILDQDLAPAHRAKKTQVFLRSILPSFVPASETPLNSQDLHPLDYCLWSVLKERLTKYNLIPNFPRLSEILRSECASIPQAIVKDSCASCLRRVRKMERANGFYI